MTVCVSVSVSVSVVPLRHYFVSECVCVRVLVCVGVCVNECVSQLVSVCCIWIRVIRHGV